MYCFVIIVFAGFFLFLLFVCISHTVKMAARSVSIPKGTTAQSERAGISELKSWENTLSTQPNPKIIQILFHPKELWFLLIIS